MKARGIKLNRLATIAWMASVIVAGSLRAADEPHAPFEKEVRPLLETYCLRCHSPQKHKGDVDLSIFKDESAIIREPRLWGQVLEQLNDRTMPPAKKPQPSAAERLRVTAWIHDALTHIDPAKLPKDPGRVTIHRLNRAEYNNTVRDLLGVDSRPADLFPADGAGGGGFDNNADTLFIPPLLMEQYLQAAGMIVKEASPDKLFTAHPGDGLSERDAGTENPGAVSSPRISPPRARCRCRAIPAAVRCCQVTQSAVRRCHSARN